ncbi:hypothetical protein [Leuconostoc fallax]|uniref:PepSY domain-containing protein n=1 Tax=Leuconostoc fallax TaxID=1251 RepID=A0A4V3A2E1_9LACO|nr:hypothetical protein [Leuconostoc fallax]MBU7455743.1 hypothetical protein [Leuconostoc fallax]TDG68018.1 hypothetical protein C5L23_000324 [Leuconostoc fallax]
MNTSIVTKLSCGLAGFSLGMWLFSKSAEAAKPHHVLDNVKHQFGQEGKILGSWINRTPQRYQKFAIKYIIYGGGITRLENNVPVNYLFMADAHTGSIINIKREAE